ncbi:MAG: hypothetical protein SVV03_04345 [Candidatus Nanohaloarchaea archaeon]|nr:hypothetical protein [Candidatus Nanohaloarchaea archaeon]
MELQRSTSIDKLYKEVQEFDLVLTVEAPLADALNNRVEKPVLDRFATTPLRLVLGDYENEQLMRKRELFLHLVQETELGWKEALHVLENIISCWEHTGQLRGILGYDRFNTEEVGTALEAIEGTKNVFSQMQDFEIHEELDVAVIGYRHFNRLDRQVLPEEFEKIDVFEDGKDKLPPFKIYSSATTLVGALEDNISRENKDDVAIVLEPNSEYQALVESILDAKGITYLLPAEFQSDETFRVFLETLEKSVAPQGLKLGDVQPLLKNLEVEIDERLNNQLLEKVDNPELDRFKELMYDLESSTFRQAIQKFQEITEENLREVKEQLEELGFLDRQVS